MNSEPENRIERSWHANATAWSKAVRQAAIPSRVRGTDAAILEAVLECGPRLVLDVGCGEGWLARALADHDVGVVGIDASPTLVQHARAAGGGSFRVCSYNELVADPTQFGADFDVVVCNYSLFEQDVSPTLKALRSLLVAAGVLVIQTVHPWTARGTEPYVDGWRSESFAAFPPGFSEPMPWYFRTLESWTRRLHDSGYSVVQLREPIDETSGDPLSLLLVATPSVDTPVARIL